jgi:hypothetical protein
MIALPKHLSLHSTEQRLGRTASMWIIGFVLLQMVCQVALLFSTFGSVRVLVRCSVFGSSLALLVFLPGKQCSHPARPWVIASLLIVFLSLAHPTTNCLLAGTAQAGLYLATLAPLLWVGRLRSDFSTLLRVLLILWFFHTTSAAFGVLQVYYPGRFQPNVSGAIQESNLEGLKISLASGERVFRPMGLTDVPGGAASAGLLAFLFGLGFLLNTRAPLVRAIALGSMAVGLFCIYLSQVRSTLLMAGVCVLVYSIILILRNEMNRLAVLAVIVPSIVLASFVWAVAVGGDSVTHRLSSLIEERPDQVYYSNRGHFLEETVFDLLPQYPLGAGLGRWGMMNAYFGDYSDPNRGAIWAEIQWTAWVLDGGAPLIIAFGGAIFVTCWLTWRISISRESGLFSLWAPLILAYDVGIVALTFNYPIFLSQGGMEFWLLNALLYSAAVRAPTAETSNSQANSR